jgi:ABC-type branched-subunit amino acid transport system ATPase component
MRPVSTHQEAMATEPILCLRNLVKSFDGVSAVADLTLDVPAERIVGLIGPNGSGKTTVFNLITGFQRPDSGRICFLGTRITGRSPDQIARLGIGRTFQNIRLFPQVSVLDNVLLALRHTRGERLGPALMATSRVKAEMRESEERAGLFLNEMGLADMRDRLAGELSHGQRRLLELARVMALDSRMILLDEPMESGAKIAEGRPEEIRENEQVIRSYTGRAVGPQRSS